MYHYRWEKGIRNILAVELQTRWLNPRALLQELEKLLNLDVLKGFSCKLIRWPCAWRDVQLVFSPTAMISKGNSCGCIGTCCIDLVSAQPRSLGPAPRPLMTFQGNLPTTLVAVRAVEPQPSLHRTVSPESAFIALFLPNHTSSNHAPRPQKSLSDSRATIT